MYHVKEHCTEKNGKNFNNGSVLDIKYEECVFSQMVYILH